MYKLTIKLLDLLTYILLTKQHYVIFDLFTDGRKIAMKIKDLIEELIEKTPEKGKLSKKDLKVFSKKVADRVVTEIKKAVMKRASEHV